MTPETTQQLMDDAKRMHILIEVCAGCGEPSDEDAAKASGLRYRESGCGCPAGTSLAWNPRVVDFLKHDRRPGKKR